MHKWHLRAFNYWGTQKSHVRVRQDGLVVARYKKTIADEDVRNAVQHAVAPAKLEGVAFGKKFVQQLYEEAVDPSTPRSGKQRRAS